MEKNTQNKELVNDNLFWLAWLSWEEVVARMQEIEELFEAKWLLEKPLADFTDEDFKILEEWL